MQRLRCAREAMGTIGAGRCGRGSRACRLRAVGLGRRDLLDEGVRRSRDPGRPRPRGRPQGRVQAGQARARAQPRHVRRLGVLQAARPRHRPRDAGPLAGLGRRAPGEPARGPLRARPGEAGRGHRRGALRLLPRLARRPERDRALRAHPRLRGRVRARVGDEGRGQGPAPRREGSGEARPPGCAGRPFARRLDHHRVRDLGLQREAGRQGPLRPRLHRRRQQPDPGHARAGDRVAPGARGRHPVAGVRGHRGAVPRDLLGDGIDRRPT